MASDAVSAARAAAAVLGMGLILAGLCFGGGASQGAPPAVSGVRLIMVEEAGCRFCRKWDAEIAPGYARSAEGRFAPLERVHRGAPELRGLAPIVFTPTFVVVRSGSGEEVGRIVGYPGADYFYGELTPILSVAGFLPGF